MQENGQSAKNRCKVCDSRTLANGEVRGEDLMLNLSKKEIVDTGGRCPRCDAQIFRRESGSGCEFYQTGESPLHTNLAILSAGAFAIETGGEPELEKTIGRGESKSRCDVAIDVPGHDDEDWNGLAIEVIVDNKINIETKRKIYHENGYTLIRVYPRDAVRIFDTDRILSRELDNY